MARRFEATVYSEKGREFKLYINDANYSGVINPIRLVTLNLNWDSNRKKGSERFAPVIGSTCDFSFFVNSSILQTFVEQLVEYPCSYFVSNINSFNTKPKIKKL